MAPGKEKRFLVLGETGSGKSTFINIVDNFFAGVKTFDKDKIRLVIPNNKFYKTKPGVIHSERDNAASTESQTDGVTLYNYSVGNDDFVFMDTPGFGDTRGSKQDEINVNKIIQEASNTDYLNGIILVINGTLTRFTQNVLTVFTLLKGFFPTSMEKNIILVMTNTSSAAANFRFQDMEAIGIRIPKENVFIMNNMAFSKDPSTYDKYGLREAENTWEQAMDEIEKLLPCAAALKPIQSTVFKEILEKRTDIKLKILDIQNKIKSKQAIQTKLKALQASHPDVAANIEQYKNFKKTIEVEEMTQQPTSSHNTVCLTCQSNCHPNCGLNEIPGNQDGSNEFKGCAAFRGSASCKCEHDHSCHAHRRFIFSKEKKSVEKVEADMKALHDQYVDLQNKNVQEEQGLSADLSRLQAGIDTDQKIIQKSAGELRALCSGFNLAKDIEVSITGMEQYQNQLFDPDARRDNQKLIDSLKELCKGFGGMLVGQK